MEIEAKFIAGESFRVVMRDALDLSVHGYIDMQQAAKLKDDLTVALQEYDAEQVRRDMEAVKYMEES